MTPSKASKASITTVPLEHTLKATGAPFVSSVAECSFEAFMQRLYSIPTQADFTKIDRRPILPPWAFVCDQDEHDDDDSVAQLSDSQVETVRGPYSHILR